MNRFQYAIKRSKKINWCQLFLCEAICINHFKTRTINGKQWLCPAHHISQQAFEVNDYHKPELPKIRMSRE